MAGRVAAHIMIDDSPNVYWVEPETCPVADDHRAEAAAVDAGLTPRCLSHHPLVGRRTCPYWYGMTLVGNAAHRTDAALLVHQATDAGKHQLRCGVLCLGQRRNRPAGV